MGRKKRQSVITMVTLMNVICSARNEREASKKASSKTYFDLIVNGTPEQLALFVTKLIEKSKSYPKLGDYNVILESIKCKVNEDEE